MRRSTISRSGCTATVRPVRGLPWSRPRFEVALVALVALTLTQLYVVNSQDVSRLCLSKAFVHGKVEIESCAGEALDEVVPGGKVRAVLPTSRRARRLLLTVREGRRLVVTLPQGRRNRAPDDSVCA